jgi:hypothetical protein
LTQIKQPSLDRDEYDEYDEQNDEDPVSLVQ